MELTEMTPEELRKYISAFEHRRDFLGCYQDDIDQLNAARTELVRR